MQTVRMNGYPHPRCLDGWYGHDCARRKAGEPTDVPGEWKG